MTGFKSWTSGVGSDSSANCKLTHSRSLFLYFCRFYYVVNSKTNALYKNLPMNGFEPRTSGVGSNCSADWATTNALELLLLNRSLSFNSQPFNVLKWPFPADNKTIFHFKDLIMILYQQGAIFLTHFECKFYPHSFSAEMWFVIKS